MTRTDGLIQQPIVWASERGDGPSDRQAVAAWRADDPSFAPYGTAGQVVRAGWADRVLGDELVSALARLDHPLAAQAALAILAPRLAGIVGRWARGGVTEADLDDLEAELVTETLARLRGGPDDPTPRGVVDAAWGRVRNGRRRHRAQAARCDPLVAADGLAAPTETSAAQTAAGLVVDAVRTGRLSVTAAQAVYVTAVAGWPTAEAAQRLRCQPDALRARRSRAVRSLAA